MIIAISSKGKNIKDGFDPRFGRCEGFIIYDTSIGEFRYIDNMGKNQSGGAGTGAAQQVFNEKANVIITGNLGGNAFKAVNVSDMRAYRGIEGRDIKELIQLYMNDGLEPIESASNRKFK